MTDDGHTLLRKLATIFRLGDSSAMRRSGQDPETKDCVARPTTVFPRCTWSAENILVLNLSDDDAVDAFANSLCQKGADISYSVLDRLEDIFHLPLEQYTMVIMGTGVSEPDIDVADIGGILRRADHDLTLVWASSQFKITIASDAKRRGFCDIQLAVPTLPETLSAAMGWPSASDPSRG